MIVTYKLIRRFGVFVLGQFDDLRKVAGQGQCPIEIPLVETVLKEQYCLIDQSECSRPISFLYFQNSREVSEVFEDCVITIICIVLSTY